MKIRILVLSLLLLTGFTAATNQTQTETVESDPGLIKPDSPLYNAKLAVDNTLLTLGISDPADLAHQRASEAATAYERGNNEAADKALDNLNHILESTNETHSNRLNQTSQLLVEVNRTAPGEATHGLETALTSIEQAENRAATRESTPQDQRGQVEENETDVIPSLPDQVPSFR